MLTMAHRLATMKFSTIGCFPNANDSPLTKAASHIQSLSGQLPAICASNVCAFCNDYPKERTFDLEKDCFNVAPALKEFVLWYDVPGENGQVGQIVCSSELDGHHEMFTKGGKIIDGERFQESKWLYVITPFVVTFGGSDANGGEPMWCGALVYMAVHTDGRPTAISIRFCDPDLALELNLVGEVLWMVTVFGTTISFMHCKNVEMNDATSDVSPGRKWLQRKKCPEIKTYTLDINPMKKVLRTEGGIETNGLKKALHICRGHFAHYTDENPLFGRITGTFWKPQHVRGSKEFGEVKKDYRIKV